MDKRIQRIEEGLKRMLRETESSFLAMVGKDEAETVDVKDFNDALYPQVRKSATKGVRGFIPKLKKGSFVIVSRIACSNDLFVSMFSEIEGLELMGGENGGLVMVEELTKKLNALVSEIDALKMDYAAHTHPTPAGPSGPPTPPFTGTFSQFSKDDFENKKITH